MTREEIVELFDERIVALERLEHEKCAVWVGALRDLTDRELSDRESECDRLSVLAKIGGRRVDGELKEIVAERAREGRQSVEKDCQGDGRMQCRECPRWTGAHESGVPKEVDAAALKRRRKMEAAVFFQELSEEARRKEPR